MKNPWTIVGIITVLLFGGAIYYSQSTNEESNQGVVVTEHVKGNPDATVTLVEYSDFQCPACSAFQPVLQDIMNTYGDRIRFEYRHYPLPIHAYAQQAAIAAEAAGQQGKFFEFHDLLFLNQKNWVDSKTPNTLFLQYAQDLGLDVETFKTHQKSSLLKDAVKANLSDAREKGLTGTPTFFLNGTQMEIKTYEDFVAQVAAAVDPTGALASSTASSTSGVTFGI